MLKPDACFDKITDIPIEFFKTRNINGLILDLDNTIIDLQNNYLEGVEDWIKTMKQANIKICIATNSISKDKIEKISSNLEIPYVNISLKPLKKGVKKAIKILNLKTSEIAEIGDQLFTDVLVSNRMNIYSILTQPISKDRFKLDIIKRKIEKWILSKQKI